MVLFVEEVEKVRFGSEFFLEDKDAFGGEDGSDFGFRVEQIAENAGTGRANFEACGECSLAGAVQAEGAFFHHPLRADPVAEIALFRIDLFFGDLGFGPIEAPGVVGAGGFTIAAANAPVVVDYHDAVLFLPGGFDRADVDTGWVVALLALDRHVEFVILGNRMVVVGVAVFHVHRALAHFQNPDVGIAGCPVVVVFLVTGLGAAAAANADAEVESVTEFDSFLRAYVFDRDVGPVLFFGFLFESFDDFSELVRCQFAVVGLEELFDRSAFFPFGDGGHGFGKSGEAKGGPGPLQEVAPVEHPAFTGGTVVAGALIAAGFFGR